MAKYKPDQGVHARTTALWLLGALWAFGCYSLYYWLLSFRGEDGTGVMITPLVEGDLPVLGAPLTIPLIVAVVLGLGGVFMLFRVFDKPKVADMLIDSETEMRKCTWPSWHETFSSSVVILAVMIFFTAVLAGMDWMLNLIMTDYVF